MSRRTTITRHTCCRGTVAGFLAAETHAAEHRGDPDAPPLPCLHSGGPPCEFAAMFRREPPYPPLAPDPDLEGLLRGLDDAPPVPERFDLEALLDKLDEMGHL